MIGRERVARFVHAFADRFWAGSAIEPIEVNGDPGVLLSRDGTAYAIVTLTADEAGISQLLWMMNPDKINPLQVAGRSAGTIA